ACGRRRGAARRRCPGAPLTTMAGTGKGAPSTVAPAPAPVVVPGPAAPAAAEVPPPAPIPAFLAGMTTAMPTCGGALAPAQ
ncbi:hypothetical protein, partial [Mycobacterium asiaticum]|uniref:hypothetical protein n=1 Tax=Mycobacterium asiaticum TaxID=1790 RepID=UPI001F164176